jgi:hypothetical protein
MRVGIRWLEQMRITEAVRDHEDVEDVALYLFGADEERARRKAKRTLRLVADAGGEVA